MEPHSEIPPMPHKSVGAHRRRMTVQELMKHALDHYEGDEDQAIDFCVDTARRDSEYVREIFALAIQAMSKDGRSTARRRARVAISSADRESVRELSTSLARPMLDFPLQDGTILKNATAEQVAKSGEQFGAQGRTMVHISRWLSAVHVRMDKTRKVAETIDELTARNLFDETKNGE